MKLSDTIAALLAENRKFAPPQTFAEKAFFNDPSIYERAAADPVTYWEDWARKLDWYEPWTKALEWNPPFAKWFLGGKLNACHNCVDRHVAAGAGASTAIVWEGEPGDVRTITYEELLRDVSRLANALKALGVQKGDRVCIYMPMVPALAMTMPA
jgi:acetyl-CoA synthetase